jgi:SPASM domain peptide maturase of grasp-with-spasm system
MKNYRIFESCFVFKGAFRSIIVDTQRNDYDFIPNQLFEILSEKYFSLEILISKYGIDNIDTLSEYIEFLLDKEYIFEVDTSMNLNFPDMDKTYKYPGKISNSIIECDEFSIQYFEKIISKLEKMGCKKIELRFFNTVSIARLKKMLAKLEFSRITTIDILIPFNLNKNFIESINQLSIEFARINLIFINGSPFSSLKKSAGNSFVIYSRSIIKDSSSCGKISPFFFQKDLEGILESMKYNSCLHNKLSIDSKGNIKNCPSCNHSYGNINSTDVNEIIESRKFKSMWSINKDLIEICKDCEFRHICTDCRVYIQDPKNIYSKPAKCSYDPYTGTWGDENLTNNPLYGQ